MIDREPPVTEEELHAFVDGELAADRRAAVERWLASHVEDAARVAAWRAQADAIRARYGAAADEPVPARFDLDRLARQGRKWSRYAAAAAVIALLIGGAAGWFGRGAWEGAGPIRAVTTEAFDAHRLYIAEVRHPIEVKAEEDHLMPWLSRRVGTTLRAPNLEAYSLKLLGGRLLPGPNGAAALFMYETPAGERYTFYCSRANTPRTALRYNAAGDAAAVLWVESDMGYVVSGPAERERLIEIAQSAYREIESRLPTRSTENRATPRRGS